MANKFEKAKGVKGIKEVAQKSNEEANLITIKYYKDEDLIDYPRNNEDLDNTEDLEKSIAEQGFTDPIEITDFGMDEGKFTIVSGHRRRMAGRKQGLKKFPCILRKFKSEQEVYNYVLYSNAQRDSAKDPLLFAKRYKMHEEYLKESGFKGSLREEIAKRLGLKVAQADRYNSMNKVILPLWDMVREGKIGMSSITDSGLHTHKPQEQEEILQIINECLETGNEITRPTVRKIVWKYREGKRSWKEVIQNENQDFMVEPAKKEEIKGDGVSVMNINTEPTETKNENTEINRNNEVNYDYSHREGLESENDRFKEERLNEEDMEVIDLVKHQEEKEIKEKKPPLTEEEKKMQAGEKIYKNLTSLDGLLNDFYKFKDEDEAEVTLKTMGSLVKLMFAEMEKISDDYKREYVFKKAIEEINNELKLYNK